MAGLLDILGKAAAIPGRAAVAIGEPIIRGRAAIIQDILDKTKAAQTDADRQALKGGTGRGGILSQFGTETAGQIGPLLESENPQMQALGSSLLGQLVGAKAAPKGLPFDERMMTPAQRVTTQDQRSQFGQTYALQQAGQANDVANADRNYALDQRRTAVYEDAQRAAMQASQAQARQVGLFGGLDQKEWLDRGEKTRAVAQAVGAGRGMVKILQEYGNVGKIASPEARAALEVGMFSLIPALQASINAGGQNALGTEERDYLQAFMGNPQEFVLRPEVTIAKLSGIVKKLESDLDYRSSTMPYLPSQAFIVPSYDLPPGLVPLSMQQQGPGFYEQIGSGAINPGYGIPR